MHKTVLLLITLGNIAAISGQQNQLESNLEEVRITGKFSETPYIKADNSVQVITRADIVKAAASSIDELLEQYTGINVQKRGINGVQSDLSVRGGSFDQVLILLNGVRMSDAQTGHNTMNIPVDMRQVERIEVTKGPGARRYGNGAYAVINIITTPQAQQQASVEAFGGDYAAYGLIFGGHFATGNTNHFAQAASPGSEGYRHNTDYTIQNGFYQNEMTRGRHRISLQAGFQEKKFGANGFYASPLASEQYEETQASVVSIAHRVQTGKVRVNSLAYWRRAQDMYLFNRNKPEIYRNMHIGNTVGAEANVGFETGIGTAGIGADYRKEILRSNNLGARERNVLQLFAEHRFSFLGDRLSITPAITYANIQDSGDFFYPGIDLGIKLAQNHRLYGSVSKVNRIPTYTDLYYRSSTEIGNATLQPETEWSYEAGYRFLKNKMLFEANFFGRDGKNGIDWVKERATDKWQAQNVGNVQTLGFDAVWKHTIGNILENYSLSYTYLDKKIEQKYAFSKYVIDYLRHQFSAKTTFRYAPWLQHQVVYRFEQRGTGTAYHLLDTRLAVGMDQWEVYGLVNNVTATKYTEAFGVPMPGRMFQIGARYTIR